MFVFRDCFGIKWNYLIDPEVGALSSTNLEVNSLPSLAPTASIVKAAQAEGVSQGELVVGILETALRRYQDAGLLSRDDISTPRRRS